MRQCSNKATFSKLLIYCVLGSAQPSTLNEMENKNSLRRPTSGCGWLGRRYVCLMICGSSYWERFFKRNW